MATDIGDRVGALLSVCTSGASFENAFVGLSVLYERELDSAIATLTSLLQKDFLFSTAHKLQAVSLLYQSDPGRSTPLLQALAAQTAEPAAVRQLASTLTSGRFAAVKSLTPDQFLVQQQCACVEDGMPGGSGLAAAAAPGATAALAREETLDSLGIAEVDPADGDGYFVSAEAALGAAAAGPLLPKAAGAALRALECAPNLARAATEAALVSAAGYNPAVAAEALCLAERSNFHQARLWTGRCLDALSQAPSTLNLMSCMASVNERMAVDPAVLSAFIMAGMDTVICMEDTTPRNRTARMLGHFMMRVMDTNISAVLAVLDEIESFCTQFFSQQIIVDLYSKLAALR